MWVWTVKCSPLHCTWTISQSVEGGERSREPQQLPGLGQSLTESMQERSPVSTRGTGSKTLASQS